MRILTLGIVLTLASLGLVRDTAAITFDDGLVHVIDSAFPFDHFIIDDGPGGPTTLQVLPGAMVGAGIDVLGTSQVVMQGGQVNQLRSFESSSVEIYGGTLTRQQFFNDDSIVMVTGGTFQEDIFFGGSTLTITDLDSVRDFFSSGIPEQINVHGGVFTGRFSVQATEVFLTGGDFTRKLSFGASDVVKISGGALSGGIKYAGTAACLVECVIDGGLINGVLELDATQQVTIVGSDFNYPLGSVPGLTGTLTGTLADGSSLNVEFARATTADIVLVPEPGTALLLTAGLLGLATYRRGRPPGSRPL